MSLLLIGGRAVFLHRCKAPPKPSATQSYGQGPAGTLTIGFEEQVKVWLAHTDRKVTDPYLLPSKGSVSPISQTLIGKLDPCPLIRLSILSFFVYFPFNFCMPSSITKGVNFHPNIFLVNKSSGPLPTVPNICCQLFGTIADGP